MNDRRTRDSNRELSPTQQQEKNIKGPLPDLLLIKTPRVLQCSEGGWSAAVFCGVRQQPLSRSDGSARVGMVTGQHLLS
eukprot:767915-Hanusia_phi.AAC.2